LTRSLIQSFLKFVRRVTDRAAGKLKGLNHRDPEYWGFACIFEDEMTESERENSLDLLLTMKTRVKYPYPEMISKSTKLGMTKETADAIIDKLAIIGMLEYDYGDKYTKDGPIPEQRITGRIVITGYRFSFLAPLKHKHEYQTYGKASRACHVL
jgi:hypothetical protein